MPNDSGTHHKYGKKRLDKMSKNEKKKFFMRQTKRKKCNLEHESEMGGKK